MTVEEKMERVNTLLTDKGINGVFKYFLFRILSREEARSETVRVTGVIVASEKDSFVVDLYGLQNLIDQANALVSIIEEPETLCQ